MKDSQRAATEILPYASATTPRRRIDRLAWIIFGVAVFIFAVAILLPVLQQPRVGTNRQKCASDMHQIGLAMIMYANDDPLARFPDDLQPLITIEQLSPEVFACPSTNDTRAPGATLAEQASHLYDGGHESYFYLGAGLTSNAPGDVVVLLAPLSNHGDGSNVLFADGHVEFLKKPAFGQVVQMLQNNLHPIYWPPHRARQP